ncbi:MAG TPA: type I polyketide synthase, partial [Gemmatimonadales bacterium]|nr:type I polyketide synthase [Gemmatimonadales bacterium]
ALLATFGPARAASAPLWLGSIKSNLGHTQAASGVAGVIKMVLALEHGLLPRTLHASEPSRHVDWPGAAVQLLNQPVPWPAGERPRRAGVSAFGISGTNAHVVLEEAPRAAGPAAAAVAGAAAPPPHRIEPAGGDAGTAAPPLHRLEPASGDAGAPAVPLLLSARSEAALRGQAERLRDHLRRHPDLALVDVACSLATTRTHFDHRAALVARDRAGGLAALEALARSGAAGVVGGPQSMGGRLALLFSGQGSQRAEMGKGLYESFAVFRDALDEVCGALDERVGRSVRSLLFAAPGSEAAGLLDQTRYTQAALFALEVAQFRLLEAWGVRADVLLGHSLGEVVAAHVAGVLTLADACALVAERGRLMQALPGGGAMAAVDASEDEVGVAVGALGGRVSLAAVNGPRSLVVSGDADAVEDVSARLQGLGRKVKRLAVSHAFHSARMDAMLEAFARVVRGLRFGPARIPIVSNLTGERASDAALTSPAYWVRQVREAVRFGDGVGTLWREGVRTFLEVGPDGVLAGMAAGCTPAGSEEAGAFVATLRRERPEAETAMAAVGQLHVRGHAVDWRAVFAPHGARPVELPTYAFQRERYWLDGAPPAQLDPVMPGRYQVAWRPSVTPGRRELSGRWLLVLPPDEPAATQPAAALARAFAAHGAELVPVRASPGDAERGAMAARLRAAVSGGAARGVISLAALDETPLASWPALPRGVALTLALVQALGDAAIPAPLWLVTRGAVSIRRGEPLTHPVQALTWGLGRVAAIEHPERWGGLLDLPEVSAEVSAKVSAEVPGSAAIEPLLDAIAGPGDEDEFALRRDGLFVRRLVPAPPVAGRPVRDWSAAGAVLVTGGTGGLGAHVARWLARQGARHLVLASRRGPGAPGAAALEAELRGLGARVAVVACDASDRAALSALLAQRAADAPPVSAVFHAAGAVHTAPIAATTLAEFAEVASGKVAGARHLHELLDPAAVEVFVTFSSLAGAVGNVHQGAYAAANAFLDALAEHRRGEGRPATSIAWGPWAGDGMAADPELQALLHARGLSAMAAPRALAALEQELAAGEATAIVADVDWGRLAAALIARPRSLLDELPGARRALEARFDGTSPSGGATDLAVRLRGRSEHEQLDELLALVRAETAAVLGYADADRVDLHKGFAELGLSSLSAVELRQRLSRATGLRLPATVSFDHPSPRHVAAYLREQLDAARGQPAATGADGHTQRASERDGAGSQEPLAIIGMGLRLPGGVADLDGLFRMLARGLDAVGPIPAERWDTDRLYDPDFEQKGKSYVRDAALLDRVDLFDAGFFGISPREARHIDPQHRLLLEAAWQALEDAGLPPPELEGTPTGVFVGVGPSDYGLLGGADDAYTVLGTHGSFAAGRLAFTLRLHGPALAVDTACSSSLVALHLACQALRRGECNLALAAGVQVLAAPEPFVLLSRTRALAPDGRSKTFSARADGYGRGEGVVVLALQRLCDARARGHRILAVVRGSAVNHDGQTSGITVPNGTSQQKVLRGALADARLSPAEVDVVECHGTGTALGDPIEVQALAAVYGEHRDPGRPLLLGAVKTNIGHLESAAGLAGVAKVVAALRHEALPPTLHTTPRNPHVDWDRLAVRVVDSVVPWPKQAGGRPRRAGVSAFGLSGTNAHVILEEAAEVAAEPRAAASAGLPADLPFVLSGKSEAAVRGQAA